MSFEIISHDSGEGRPEVSDKKAKELYGKGEIKAEEKSPEKIALEKAAENLRNFEKKIDALNNVLEIFESKEEKSSEDEMAIEKLKQEIKETEAERFKVETAYEISSLKNDIAELKKEVRVKEFGLSELEAKEAVNEMKKETKALEVKGSAEKNPAIIRMDSNIAELEKDIEATKKGLSSSPVDIRMKLATLSQLKKERAAMAEEFVQDRRSDAIEIKTEKNEFGSEGEQLGGMENGRPSAKSAETEKKFIPKSAEVAFKDTYEKVKEKEANGTRWGGLKEKIKNIVSGGLYELWYAEKFRRRTNEAAKDIKLKAARIQQTEVLDLDSALDEAGRMKELAEKEGKFDSKSIKKRDLKKYSESITNQKREENSRLINDLIEKHTKYLEKQLGEYKDENGNPIVNVNKLDAFRNRLRKELESLQRGFIFNEEIQGKGELAQRGPSKVREAVFSDPEVFKKTVRESLNENYWRKYFYFGLDKWIEERK